MRYTTQYFKIDSELKGGDTLSATQIKKAILEYCRVQYLTVKEIDITQEPKDRFKERVIQFVSDIIDDSVNN